MYFSLSRSGRVCELQQFYPGTIRIYYMRDEHRNPSMLYWCYLLPEDGRVAVGPSPGSDSLGP